MADWTEPPWPCFSVVQVSHHFVVVVVFWQHRLARGIYLLANGIHKKPNSNVFLGFLLGTDTLSLSFHSVSKTKSHYQMHSQGMADTTTHL